MNATVAVYKGSSDDWEDAVAILAIVALNTILGFQQEYRAERAIAALKHRMLKSIPAKFGSEIALSSTAGPLHPRRI